MPRRILRLLTEAQSTEDDPFRAAMQAEIDLARNRGANPTTGTGGPPVLTPSASALPAASALLDGTFYYYRAAASSGIVYVCLQTSTDGVYAWVPIAQAP